MDEHKAKEIADKVIGQVFGFQNPLTLEQIQQKFAFDVRLPQQVFDYLRNEPTWAQSTNPAKFVKLEDAFNNPNNPETGDWMQPKQPINSIEDILSAWNNVNAMATERQLDSLNVAQSDNIYSSENIWRSQDISASKNILFSDGVQNGCEFIIAGQRSNSSSFCIRLEDSSQCSNSFSVSWSSGIVNSFFISDAKDMQDCMFCSHLNTKQYCIANMQFERDEYFRIKDMVMRWILTG